MRVCRACAKVIQPRSITIHHRFEQDRLAKAEMDLIKPIRAPMDHVNLIFESFFFLICVCGVVGEGNWTSVVQSVGSAEEKGKERVVLL
jgi:hypothetical protein